MTAMHPSKGKVITMVTTINETCVDYEVIDGDADSGDFGDATIEWSKQVEFGNDRRHRAGGPAFREAAQEQHKFAAELAASRGQERIFDYLANMMRLEWR